MDNFLIKTLVVGQLQTNCYLVIDRKAKDALIIDPADEAEYIIQKLLDEKITPSAILATHGHYDHNLAVFALKQAYKIPFLLHRKDLFLLKNLKRSAEFYSQIKTDPIPKVDKYLIDKEKISLGTNVFSVMESPGHTPGSVCFYEAKRGILFTGDTLFDQGGVGRTDFSYSNSQDLYRSLKRIFALSSRTVIYPGHGNPSTLSRESRFHKF